jgi:hypothetical protein
MANGLASQPTAGGSAVAFSEGKKRAVVCGIEINAERRRAAPAVKCQVPAVECGAGATTYYALRATRSGGQRALPPTPTPTNAECPQRAPLATGPHWNRRRARQHGTWCS